jgi:hypothetical protein
MLLSKKLINGFLHQNQTYSKMRLRILRFFQFKIKEAYQLHGFVTILRIA